MDLEHRIAVVTGGSTGIGFATAQRLAASGCRVAICARTGPALDEAAEQLRTSGGEILAVQTDVSREADVDRLRERVHTEFGSVDILVNNAGIGVFGEIFELDPSDFDRVFGVNVRGMFLCCRAFAPDMVEKQDGVIVNLASLAGKNPFPGGAIYAASKHAVMGFSKSLLLDLRPHGVRVLTVCPGTVLTPFFDKQEHFSPEASRALQADDVADLILSAVLMSDRATVSEIEVRPVSP